MAWECFLILLSFAFYLMGAYTQQGLGTHADSESAQHFWLLGGKLSDFSCAPGGVWTSGLWIWSQTLYQLSRPLSPLVTPCHGHPLSPLATVTPQYLWTFTWCWACLPWRGCESCLSQLHKLGCLSLRCFELLSYRLIDCFNFKSIVEINVKYYCATLSQWINWCEF